MKHRGIIITSLGLLVFIILFATVLELKEGPGDYTKVIYLTIMVLGVGIEVMVLLLLGLYHLLKGRIFVREPGKMPVIDAAWKQQQTDRRALGKVYLLCSGLILLVGFSSCLGGAYLLNEVLLN